MLLGYADVYGDLLPINNDDNFYKALSSANPLLRIIIQKRGEAVAWREEWEGRGGREGKGERDGVGEESYL